MPVVVFSISEVAEMFKVHPDTISKLIKDAKIAATKIGGQWRITEEAISEYLDSRTVKVVRRKTSVL